VLFLWALPAFAANGLGTYLATRLDAATKQGRGTQHSGVSRVGGGLPSDASKRISFHFWTRPTMIIGGDQVSAVEIERTMINSEGYMVGIGGRQTLAADHVVRSVGYRRLPPARCPPSMSALAECHTPKGGHPCQPSRLEGQSPPSFGWQRMQPDPRAP
jgi:hypothetical protein